jgi:hypothetical protein
MGKGMPQYMKEQGAKTEHRYGSDWLISGKRQYGDDVKGFQFKQHDPLGTQSTFDTAAKTGYKLGGSTRQTRFHKGFQRRRATDINPYEHRYKHDEALAQRSRDYAPVRRNYLASQTWRNGRDPITHAAQGADAGESHAQSCPPTHSLFCPLRESCVGRGCCCCRRCRRRRRVPPLPRPAAAAAAAAAVSSWRHKPARLNMLLTCTCSCSHGADPRHPTMRHGDPFDPWYNTVHRTFTDAPGGFGEGQSHPHAEMWA